MIKNILSVVAPEVYQILFRDEFEEAQRIAAFSEPFIVSAQRSAYESVNRMKAETRLVEKTIEKLELDMQTQRYSNLINLMQAFSSIKNQDLAAGVQAELVRSQILNAVYQMTADVAYRNAETEERRVMIGLLKRVCEAIDVSQMPPDLQAYIMASLLNPSAQFINHEKENQLFEFVKKREGAEASKVVLQLQDALESFKEKYDHKPDL